MFTNRTRRQLWLLALSLFVVCTFAVELGAVRLGDAQVTLQSSRYYRMWDMTCFVYRIRLPWNPHGPLDNHWVLGTGGCVTEDIVDLLSSDFEWSEDPFHGMRFELTNQQHFYIWLHGEWDVAPTQVAVIRSSGDVEVGTIDGPACEDASISIEVLNGSVIAFPAVTDAGILEADEETELRVSSTSQGWALGHGLELTIPANASYETVERVFQLTFRPYETVAGTVDIGVAYALALREEDFFGLPEGLYAITVTFTVSTD